MVLSSQFEQALVSAAQWHRCHMRRGTDIPYLSHLLAVASLVLEHGGTEEEAIAGLLHDAVEDQKAGLDEIRAAFGDAVAAIVAGCSDTDKQQKPPWWERKTSYLRHLPDASPSVLLVSASDKLHNARAILQDYRTDGDGLWQRFNGGKYGTLWSYRALVNAYRKGRGIPEPLVDELERTVTQIEHLAGGLTVDRQVWQPELTRITPLIERGTLPISLDGVAALGVPPKLPGVVPDRVEGMLLGLAIGDALGNTSESLLPSERRARHGEIRDYLENHHAGRQPVGLPSDDTQLAFWTLEQILEDGGLDPERLAATFAGRRIFGVGRTVSQFVAAHRAGKPWYEAGPPSAGNGAVMRIAPVIVPHLNRPSVKLWEDAILAGAMTHNDRSSIAACVALVGILWDVIGMERAPDPVWWVDRYCALAWPIEDAVELTPRNDRSAFRGPIWRLVDTEVRQALTKDLSVTEACREWYSGAFLLETIPTVIYILARYAADAEEAIARAVNDTRDNDTIAAIVGAAVGALHGRAGLPARWIRGLLGRTGVDDDGRVFELIEQAVRTWLPI